MITALQVCAVKVGMNKILNLYVDVQREGEVLVVLSSGCFNCCSELSELQS